MNEELTKRCQWDGDLNVHTLMIIYQTEKLKATPTDDLAGNPAKWGSTRGMTAVRDYIIERLTDV